MEQTHCMNPFREKEPTTVKKSLKVRTLKEVIPKNRYKKATFDLFLIFIELAVENKEFSGEKFHNFTSKPCSLYVHNVGSPILINVWDGITILGVHFLQN